ncbi:MAG: adenylate/guanylate cyclase domain-containing protein [Anaerolineae bacterium]|nr:MAG: adenylate/guanylate cyclase domain-containing protein [Anaerolineae bacterium]
MSFPSPFLSRRWQRLAAHGFPQQQIRRFRQFLRKTHHALLQRTNPRLFARELGWSEAYTLDFLTAAVAEGICALEWEAYCPVCGDLLQRARHLEQLHSHLRCESCHNETDLLLDEEVTPRVSLRRLFPPPGDTAARRSDLDAALGRLPAVAWVSRPLFRQLLGEEVLPPNRSLGIGHLAVFFSDLKESTRLYRSLGDARAYALVRRHFALIEAEVENEGGSVVKTIGDGMMGVFTDNARALRAMLRSVQAIHRLNEEEELETQERLRLKVGLHAGPCIIVTLNRRLDYFGSTVNIAARLSGIADGDEILVSDSLLDHAETQKIIAPYHCREEREVALRGLEKAVNICRLKPLTATGAG